MRYDFLGRMIENLEPSTSEGELGWRYVYDDTGRVVVGTSDARKCGVNFSYDAAGRLLTEDYSPCETHHEPYDAEPEVRYLYDTSDPEADLALPGVGQTFTLGKTTSVTGRASKALSRAEGTVLRARLLRGGWLLVGTDRRDIALHRSGRLEVAE